MEQYRLDVHEPEKNESKKGMKPLRSQLSTYGGLILLFMMLFFIFAEEPVSLSEITVEGIHDNDGKGVYVSGELSNEAGNFSKANVEFDEESGIARVTIKQFSTTTVFGTKEFVVYIKEPLDRISEIWLVYSVIDDEGQSQSQSKKIYPAA